ncbi:MAG: hypothetical protein N2109_12115 [Fimbriimonadales bacterium]|nr:hypothetical protein [Fimbriimonadales bacterium]
MPRYIEWYLAELERRLARRVTRERLHQLLAETETHLSERSEELRREGMEPRAAELAAIDAFGPPERLAALELGSQRRALLGLPTAWALALAAGAPFLGMAASLTVAWAGARSAHSPLVLTLALPLAAACWLAGRGAAKAIFVSAAAGWALLVVASGLVVRPVQDGAWWSRGALMRSSGELRQEARRSAGLAEWLREGRRRFFAAKGESEAPRSFQVGAPEAEQLLDAWRSTLGGHPYGRIEASPALQTGWWLFPSGVELWLRHRSGGSMVLSGTSEADWHLLPWASTARVAPRLTATPSFREARQAWLRQSAEFEQRLLRAARELSAEARRRQNAVGGWFQAHPDLWTESAAIFAVAAALAALASELVGRTATALRTRRSLGWA